ncbi:DNA polymerase III subunit delta [Angustibacter sp. McL0619]|uniref:DNA polymerase III subunit delta n=1 Tax=Angustibacter sp. McL0619 TaxID=3415676 RepID=UPI003CE8DAC4
MTPPASRAAPPSAGSGDGDPAGPLHLVSGPEELLADRAVERVVGAARAREPGVSVVQVEPVGYASGDLAAHAAPSLFGEGTVLVLHGLEEAPDELLEDAKALVLAPDPDVVLVLRHRSGQRGKGLLDAAKKAGAAVHDCPKLTSDAEKTSFVQHEFRRAGRRIAPEAVVAVVEAVGQDVRELAAACAQLMADTLPADGDPRDAETVEVDVVERYYGGRIEATGFKVADAAIAGQTDQALGLLRHALGSGVDPVPIVAVLAMGLRSLAKVSTVGSMRSADAARDLGMAPWQVDKARRQLRAWSPRGLAAAIEAVAAADLAVKGGLPSKGRRAGDPVYAVEKAVLEIGRAQRDRP